MKKNIIGTVFQLKNYEFVSKSAQSIVEKTFDGRYDNLNRIIKEVKKARNYINRAHTLAESFKKGDVSIPGAFEWIRDNYYVFSQETEDVLSSLKKNRGFAHSKVPLFFDAFLEFSQRIDCQIQKEHIDIFATKVFEKYADIRYEHILLMGTLMRASLVSRLGGVCKNICKKNALGKIDSYTKSVKDAVLSIKYVSAFDFESLLCKSPSEIILNNDPSGVYKNMTKSCKAYYRKRLGILSAKYGINESSFAESIVKKCKENSNEKAKHVGYYLYPHKRNSGKVYLTILFCVTFAIVLSLSFIITPLCLLLLFPIWEFVKQILDKLFLKFCSNIPVPSLELCSIPDDCATLVMVTTLLTGEKNDKNIFDNLEKMYCSCGEKNVYFAVVGDLTDSKSAFSEKDRKILNYARERINGLREKYGDIFFLFTRQRQYSKTQEKFMAYERKRGAVVEVSKYLCAESDNFDEYSIKPSELVRHHLKYCITLDSDTNLPIDAVRKMVGAISHPLNKPEFTSEGIVKSGFAICQPLVSTELGSSVKTPFSRIMSGLSGTDLYSGARFDLYQTIFSNGIFCGKGIFDKRVFCLSNTGKNSIKEDAVLSHDAIEGARLNCNMLTDLVLTDSYPKNELSYYKREHRWIRGDIQNLIFLSKKIKNAKGVSYVNGISSLSKFKLADNIRRHLVPVFSLVAVVLSLFCSSVYVADALVLLAVLWIIFPPVFDVVMSFPTFLSSVNRHFYSRGTFVSFEMGFLRSILSLCGLCKYALVSLDAIIRSLFRMLVSHRNMLEWTTASQSDAESADGILGYISKNLTSAIIGASIFLFAINPLSKILGLLWFFSPAVFYFTSRPVRENDAVSENSKKFIREYCRRMWGFFNDSVTAKENHLVPDNIQFFPDKKVAHRTSPTNIGLYLVSCVCAYELGFIRIDELKERLFNTFGTLEKLEKYKGHLFNWYNTRDLTVLNPRFVSSVDSGNFLACLITIKSAVRQYAKTDSDFDRLIRKIDTFIKQTDFECIYNDEKELFSIGLVVDKDKVVMSENCYDIYMSEARTLSFIAVSMRKVPVSHWEKLSKVYISKNNRLGLASWSGTAFEYFMPPIFLPIPEGSLQYEGLKFALNEQKSVKGKMENSAVWGTSESAFFAFDPSLNYQYKAHGIPFLALKKYSGKEIVISPYSTFLGLEFDEKACMKNLYRLEKNGCTGKYGFYEAIDFTSERAGTKPNIIESFMSHHIGMSFASATNVILSGFVRNCFMSDEKMNCGRMLCDERIHADVVVNKKKYKFEKDTFPTFDFKENKGKSYDFKDFDDLTCSIISDGKVSVTACNNGFVRIDSEGVCFNRATEQTHNLLNSFFVFAKINDKVYSASPCPLFDENTRYVFDKTSGKLSYKAYIKENGKEKYVFIVSFSIDSENNNSVRIFAQVNTVDKSKPCKVSFAFAFEPVICNRKQYDAHKAFADLFVSSEFAEDKNILCFTRKSRDIGENKYLLVTSPDKNTKYVCFKNKIFSPVQTKEDFENIFDAKAENVFGACINPYCLAITDGQKERNDKVSAELALALVLQGQENRDFYDFCITTPFDKVWQKLSQTENRLRISSKLVPKGNDAYYYEQFLLGKCIFPKKKIFENDGQFGKGKIWECGISGDIPFVVLFVGSAFSNKEISEYIKAFVYLNRCGFSFDLVFVCSDNDKYNKPIHSGVTESINKAGADDYICKRTGGIFIVDSFSVSDNAQKLMLFSNCTVDVLNGHLAGEKSYDKEQQITIVRKLRVKDNPVYKNDAFCVAKGYFDIQNGSYTVDKTQSIDYIMSHVLASRRLSSVLTHVSLGYTFDENSALKRITPFYNDVFEGVFGEAVFMCLGDKYYDLCACSISVEFGQGYALYKGNVQGTGYSLRVYIPEKLPVKIIEVKTDTDVKLCFAVKALMGQNSNETEKTVCEIKNDCAYILNPFSEYFDSFCFVGGFDGGGNKALLKDVGSGALNGYVCAEFGGSGEGKTVKRTFFLGSAKHEKEQTECLDFVTSHQKECFESALEFARKIKPDIRADFAHSNSVTKSVKCFFDTWLCYQNSASRFFAVSGFYQSGGAFGFRDRLQDSLTVMYAMPDETRGHIIKSCKAQFYEGDVLHWWHEIDGKMFGVRTKISDDFLFLPYVVAKYVLYTGKTDILYENVPYAKGDELVGEQHEKYMTVVQSDKAESVYEHCLKSVLRASVRLGKHGLCLIGSGDWCDGFNRVGADGIGESVWLSMFLVLVIDEFSKVAQLCGDTKTIEVFCEIAKTMRKNICSHGYDEKSGYFLRAFGDDGEVLGRQGNDENRIDAIAQAFSAIAKVGTNEQIYSSVKNSYENLFDKDMGIYKLFTPAYDKTKEDIGYVQGYVPGVRENGGQYTHAAVWACKGLFEASKLLCADEHKHSELVSMAREVLFSLLPPLRLLDSKKADAYRAEPYVLCGDVYTNPLFVGKGGWSWYTGAAGWLWRTILENAFCIEFFEIQTRKAFIKLSEECFTVPFLLFGEFSLEVVFEYCDARYTISFVSGEGSKILVDGQKASLEIPVVRGNHRLEIFSNQIMQTDAENDLKV